MSDYETVHTSTVWHDGARNGVADLNGKPHYYENHWNEADSFLSDIYLLKPLYAETMRQYSKNFLDINQFPISVKFNIQKLTVSKNKLNAVAEVSQEVVRYQNLIGKRRRVETSAVQQQVWTKTRNGWKLKLIDDTRDRKRFIEGKRVDPEKPFNPDD